MQLWIHHILALVSWGQMIQPKSSEELALHIGESGSLLSKRWDKPEQITPSPLLFLFHGLMHCIFLPCVSCMWRKQAWWVACCVAATCCKAEADVIMCRVALLLPSLPLILTSLGLAVPNRVSTLILSQEQDLGAWSKPNSKPAPGPLLRERWNSEFPPLYLCLFKHVLIFFANSWS